MSYVNLIHLKSLLMVLAAAGSVTSGVMYSAYAHKDPGSFVIGLNPSSMLLVENTTSTSTVSITSISGFAGTVALSVSFLTPGITASVSPSSATLTANGAAHSTLSLTAPATVGNYSILVLGSSSRNGKTTYSSAMMKVQVVSSQDFTIVSSPSSIISPTGSTNTTTITVTSVKGYVGNVSLTVTAPFGFFTISTGQNPLRVVAGGAASTALTITTSTLTTQGIYNITVTGTVGPKSHSTTITVQVVDPTPPPVIVENLQMSSYTFVNGTMLTIVLQNTGNGSIALTSYVISDISGNAYSLTNWNGPTIGVGQTGSATILIGNSCPSCIYSGIIGLFFQFQHGQSYTVTVTTARNHQFTFTVAD